MSAKVISAAHAEHYVWGEGCDGWYLVRTPELNIIEERMPAGAAETRHHHQKARQFFFVLAGELMIDLEGHTFPLHPGEGLEIAPGQSHQAANRGSEPVRFLVTSQPPSQQDRIEDTP